MVKGLKHQLKKIKSENKETLNVKNLEAYIMSRLKDRPKNDDYGLSKFPPRKLTWEEANSICGISEEEYENSTGLYQIGYSLTGKGGFDIYQQELKNHCQTYLDYETNNNSH